MYLRFSKIHPKTANFNETTFALFFDVAISPFLERIRAARNFCPFSTKNSI